MPWLLGLGLVFYIYTYSPVHTLCLAYLAIRKIALTVVCFNSSQRSQVSVNFFLVVRTFNMRVRKVKVLVAQLYLTLCNPMDCSLPGSSVLGILQATVLE